MEHANRGSQRTGRKKMSLKLVVLGVATMGLASGPVAYSLPPPPGLEEIPPTWSRFLDPADRSQPALSGARAVLDKETGLVWERAPSATPMDWRTAVSYCYTLEAGGRKGWRLPTVEQLASNVDPTRTSPALTKPTPYRNVRSAAYWTATTVDAIATDAWFVSFRDGLVDHAFKGDEALVWCVRGPQGYNAYGY